MYEVKRGTDGQNRLRKFMVMSGIRKELGDQGTNEYPESYIKSTYIDHPRGRHTHTQKRDKAWLPTQYTTDP
jgi:hypothetical protein